MTHKELIAEMAQRLDTTQTRISEIMEAFVEVTSSKLAEENQILIQNFGLFETKKRSERIAVNPQTQQRYLVPPTIVATFKPAAGLKDELKNMDDDGE